MEYNSASNRARVSSQRMCQFNILCRCFKEIYAKHKHARFIVDINCITSICRRKSEATRNQCLKFQFTLHKKKKKFSSISNNFTKILSFKLWCGSFVLVCFVLFLFFADCYYYYYFNLVALCPSVNDSKQR